MIKGLTFQNIETRYHARGRSLGLSPGVNIPGIFPQLEIIRPGAVSAWWEYPSQVAVICIKGALKAVFFDARRNASTSGEVNEYFIGEMQPGRLSIPEGVYCGWQNAGPDEAWLIVFATDPPRQILPPENDFIPYRW